MVVDGTASTRALIGASPCPSQQDGRLLRFLAEGCRGSSMPGCRVPSSSRTRGRWPADHGANSSSPGFSAPPENSGTGRQVLQPFVGGQPGKGHDVRRQLLRFLDPAGRVRAGMSCRAAHSALDDHVGERSRATEQNGPSSRSAGLRADPGRPRSTAPPAPCPSGRAAGAVAATVGYGEPHRRAACSRVSQRAPRRCGHWGGGVEDQIPR